MNKRPTRVAVKLAIAQAICHHTIEQIGKNAPKQEMFPVNANEILNDAIDKAYEEAEVLFNKINEGVYE